MAFADGKPDAAALAVSDPPPRVMGGDFTEKL
jgi:hypothetical protein